MKDVEINNNKKKKKIKRKWLVVSLCFLCAILIGLLSSLFFTPKISLKGGKEITLNIHDKYKESGVKATYHGKNISDEIKIDGKVDVDKEGTYKIVYTVKKGFFKNQTVRIVTIKDLEPPKITLVGNQDVYLCKNAEYQELGYDVSDNLDKNLKDKVEVDIKDNEVVYQVTDKAGNKAEVSRKLIYEDKDKPVITLTGSENVSITVGSKYQELGYKAIDNCDNDLTKQVIVKNNIDSNKIGNYEVTYTVTDSSGNTTVKTRKVNVKKKVTSKSSKSNSNSSKSTNSSTKTKGTGGVIYLTFDDGPNQGTTDVILNILKEEGVKATFFVTNKEPDSLIKREYDEGHTVGLHTASHNYKTVYSSVDAYFDDLNKVHDRVQRITGYDSKIIRFPGGSSNTVSKHYSIGIMTKLTKEVTARGYHYFDWNVDSDDAGKAKSSTSVYNNVIKSLSRKRNNIVLMHDIKPYTRDALRNIIRYGKNNGYKFETITMNTPVVHHSVNN